MSLAERIERREYKYLVDETTAAAVRQAVTPFCRLDAYGAREPSGRYFIESLYLDTPTFALFVANQRKLVDRFKLRIRHYPATLNSPVFLEVKRRCNDVVLKTRGRLASCEWKRLLDEGDASPLQALSGANRAAAERFVALSRTYQARPVTLVRYEREAWVSEIDDYARVTFDRQVRSQAHEGWSLESEPQSWRSMDNAAMQRTAGSMVVIELKFTSTVPRWMVSLVQRCNLLRDTFSKYGTSVLTWHLAPVALAPSPRGAFA